jgi:hypothetical protein
LTDRLRDLAEGFADDLTALVQGTIGGQTEFAVGESAQDHMVIGPDPLPNGRIPLVRDADRGLDEHRVELRAWYRCGLDPEGEHLMVESSTFGLWVRPSGKWRPVVRVEYERTPRTKDHPTAHVHLHAESAELAWLYGSSNLELPRLHQIHFPAGGRRFRPTLEQFLQFLSREQLFTEWAAKDWRKTLDDHQAAWEERQARATVRRYPDAAAEELRGAGWNVTPPVDP